MKDYKENDGMVIYLDNYEYAKYYNKPFTWIERFLFFSRLIIWIYLYQLIISDLSIINSN